MGTYTMNTFKYKILVANILPMPITHFFITTILSFFEGSLLQKVSMGSIIGV